MDINFEENMKLSNNTINKNLRGQKSTGSKESVREQIYQLLYEKHRDNLNCNWRVYYC